MTTYNSNNRGGELVQVTPPENAGGSPKKQRYIGAVPLKIMNSCENHLFMCVHAHVEIMQYVHVYVCTLQDRTV